jgi:hypothetical protein
MFLFYKLTISVSCLPENSSQSFENFSFIEEVKSKIINKNFIFLCY